MFPGIITGVAAAGGVFAYGAAAAKSQLFGRTFFGAPGTSKQLALTYDDGPNDPWTQKLLDVLDRHAVKATFFLIGRYVEMRPEIARAVAERGHVVGNHTFAHPNLIFTSQSALRGELERTEAVITQALGAQATGAHSRLFRPPFGARRPATLRLAKSMGLETIMWSVKCWDWSAPSAEYIVEKARKRITGGDVILLHDGGHVEFGADRAHTVAATDELIRRYKGEGYEFVTVPEMQSAVFSLQ